MPHREILKLQSIYQLDVSKIKLQRKLPPLLLLTSSSLSLRFFQAWLSTCIHLNHLFFFFSFESTTASFPFLWSHNCNQSILPHSNLHIRGGFESEDSYMSSYLGHTFPFYSYLHPPPAKPTEKQTNKTTPFKKFLFIHLILMKSTNYGQYHSVWWFCCSTFSAAIESLIDRRKVYQHNY